MNTINETGLQNQQDFWAQLYQCVGESILNCCGRGGEGVVRRAVHKMAVEKGRTLNAKYKKAGIRTNLHTLYASGTECSRDLRIRQQVLRDEEDIRIWEIYTCPLAALWLDAKAEKLGNMYCEENQHGLVYGFTGNKGQLNLTKKLTCHRTNGCRADNHCRFSSYYREANLLDGEREEGFTKECGRENQMPKPEDFRKDLNEKCIQTVYYLTEEAVESYGNEGVCAVALGLRRLSGMAAELLLYHADATLNRCDRAFIHDNLPVELETASDPLWGNELYQEAAKLFELNFLNPLKVKLSID